MNEPIEYELGAIESVIALGDLGKLTSKQRVEYYLSVCQSLGLNPATQPFRYIVLNGKLTLYATKDATDQLRNLRGISIIITARERLDDLYVVTARATMGERTDESIGAVNIKGLYGDALANAIMKAETKAKRRVTLSICGLGWTDESEVDSIPGAKPVTVDMETGEIQSAEPDTPQIEAQPKAAAASAVIDSKTETAELRENPVNESKPQPAAWTREPAAVKRILNFAYGGNGLSAAELKEALGGEVTDYPHSEKEAIADIKAYIHARASQKEEL